MKALARFLLVVGVLELALPAVVPSSAVAQGCGPQNPQCIVPTAPPGDNSNRAASTAFVQNAVSGGLSLTVGTTGINGGATTRVLFDNGGILGEYTAAQLAAFCATFGTATPGCVPSSGGGTVNFLRADGTWANPGASAAIAIGSTPVTGGTTTRVLFDNAGVAGEYTNTQLTALINAFTSGLSGAVPASGGGTVNFLRADGTFAVPGAPGSNTQVPFNSSGAFSTSPDLTFVDPTLTIGANGTNSGILGLAGSTSGKVTQTVAAVAGTWTLQWPTGAGSNGQVLTTNGGSPAVLTWQNAGAGSVTSVSGVNFITTSPNPITGSGSVSGAFLGSPMGARMGAI